MVGWEAVRAVAAVAALAVMAVTAIGLAPPAGAAPAGFQNEIVLSNLSEPTGAAFTPDGRLLVIERAGTIRVAQPGATQVDPAPLLQLTNINITGGERGLVGLALDPAFASNGYYYVFYTASSPLRDRVSRFTANGNATVSGSELVVWQDTEEAALYHHGGSVEIGPDGALYVSTGDFFGSGQESQLLTSYRGKVLRVGTDGSVPADNPFFDGAGPNLDAVWARGLRNPFRMSFDPVSGRLYIADVGSNSTATSLEEVNIGAAGANYGWPACEGSCGTAGMTNPWFTYPHAGRDASITGGFVYRGSQFPAEYRGSYFYGDYVQNWIRGLRLNGDGSIQQPFNFEPADGASDGPYGEIVDLLPGPDGSLYYVDLGTSWEGSTQPGTVRRIRYLQANQAPVAFASGTPTSGAVPLEVAFSSAGTNDPEGQPLTYAWDFGDGNSSSLADPVHTYTTVGNYTARLSVSDGEVTSLSNPVQVTVGNRPSVTIDAPTTGSTFRAGDVIAYNGSAVDVEDGPMGAGAFSWRGVMRHETHAHPFFGPVDGVTAGSFTVPSMGHDFSGNVSYEVICTVTDSDGLASTASVQVVPEEVSLTFQTVPAGLNVLLDGVTRTTPFTIDAVIGFQFQIEAPDQTSGGAPYVFSSWSDGGARTHGLTVGTTDQTLVATFQQPPDTTAPSASVIAPLPGATVSGTATVAANASDNIGVVGVQFLLDGSALGAEDTAAPFTLAWNTTTVSNGPHVVTARARDAAGNIATSTPINVTVSNAVGLVAAFGFDELAGPSTANATGDGNNGAISGATWSASGRYGAALSFDGSNDLVSINDANALDLTTGMTLEAWVNPDVAPNNWRSIIAKERASNSLSYQLTASSNSGNRPATRLYAGGAVRSLSGGTRLTAGAWVHLASTYDGTVMRLFVNGVQVATQAQTGPLTATTNPLRIGGSTTMSQYFDGRVDEVRIYARALTAAEIQTDMATPITPPAPDVLPPQVASPTPAGTLPAGTTQAVLGVVTNEAATCRYGTAPGVAYDNLTTSFATTGGTAHSTTQTGLVNGGSYVFYVRCRDFAGNATTTDTTISFSVANPLPPDTTAPTVSVTTPAEGASVGQSVTVSATATDNVGVAGVQFLLDGVALGAEDTTAPYAVVWNTTTATNGPHTLSARARDAAGNLATSAVVNVTVAQPAIDPALRVAYGFNETTGTVAVDRSSTGNNATVTSGTWVSGRIGNGLGFNGTTTRARASSNVTLGGSFTYEAWIFNPAFTSYETIVTIGSNRDLYLLGGVVTFYAGQDYTFGPALPANTWTHVAVTYDGAVLRAFVNGVQRGTNQAVTLASVTAALQVGAWINGNQNADFWSGTIDEVRVYGRALTAAEIQGDMVAPIG
jgi:glucose/arabinose dehydrogenase/PKD repeat protein